MWESEVLATNLAQGRGFTYEHLGTTYRAYKPPLYELLCAGLYRLTGHSQRAVVLLQCVFGSLLAGTVTVLGSRLFGNTAGLIAGIFVALHPALVYYDTHQLHALTMAGLLVSVIVVAFLRSLESGSWRWRLVTGALVGLAVYERGTAGVLLPLGLAWLWWASKGRGRNVWALVCPVMIGFGLVVAPWIVRHYHVYDRFVFMTSLTGELLWRGNNPHASGTSVTEDLVPIIATSPQAFQEQLASLGELDQQALFRQEALAFMHEHPWEALKLFGRKVFYFWWFAPTSGYRYPSMYLIVYRSVYAVLVALALYGLWGACLPRKRWHVGTWLLLITVGSLSLTQALYYVEIRHRWVIEPLLMVFSSAGLLELVKRVQRWGTAWGRIRLTSPEGGSLR